MFVIALQCVPFVLPERWGEGPSSGALDELPAYTLHAEPAMRQVCCLPPHARFRLPAPLPNPPTINPPTAPRSLSLPRQAATAALRRCVRVLPRLRDPLLGALASFAARLPEEHTDAVRDQLALLLRRALPCCLSSFLPSFQALPLVCSRAADGAALHAPRAR